MSQEKISHTVGMISEDLLDNQYQTSLNLLQRWEVYKHSREGVDFTSEMLRSLDLSGDEAVLDIGASDNKFLKELRDSGHRGPLLGVEASKGQVELGYMLMDHHYENPSVGLIECDARDLRVIKDNTFEVITVLFMLYHLPEEDHHKVFAELTRVVKPGGRVVFSTSGLTNKHRHRQFEMSIAEELGVEAPSRMNHNFVSENAKKYLEQYFPKVEHHDIKDIIEIHQSAVDDYIESIYSMKSEFSPTPTISDYKQAVEEVVVPIIRKEIEEHGFFSDSMHRSYTICWPDKTEIN